MKAWRSATPIRRSVMGVGAAASAVVLGAGSAAASLPPGVTSVVVTAANATTGVDAHLSAAGSIAGAVHAASGGGALSASVTVFRSGHYVTSTITDGSTGAYLVGGLTSGSYAVCVGGFTVFGGGSSTTGYVGRCYKTAAWSGGTVPSGATLVAVTAGSPVTGINLSLPTAAAIAGKVTSPSGTALPNVEVYAHNRSTGQTFLGSTGSAGTYRVNSLTASSTGYTVCFNPLGGGGGTGFRPRCYRHTAWSGGSFPSTATAVSVSLGHVHTGVSVSLPRAGAITGVVTDAKNGNPVKYEAVIAFSAGGKVLQGTSTNAKGRYTLRGLAAASGDRVCAAPDRASASTNFHGKCWKNVAWNGGALPSGTTAVSVTLGKTHAGISFKLGKTVTTLGSIAGSVTDSASHPLSNASVSLFTASGAFVTSAQTGSSGSYHFAQLHPSSTGYVVCASAELATSTVSTPPTGWSPQCYNGVDWNTLKPPSSATKIPLSAGQNRSNVDVALPVGGEIDGTTTQSDGTTPAGSIQVELFTSGGRMITVTYSDSGTGAYSFPGLMPAGYVVCFDGRNVYGSAGYLPQCYSNQPWSP